MTRAPWMVITPTMMRHCVYVWKKSNPDGADVVMYVGSSTNGVRRLAGHHALPFDYEDDDYIEFYPCTQREHALSLELCLIRELQPLLNVASVKDGSRPGSHESKCLIAKAKARHKVSRRLRSRQVVRIIKESL